MAKLQSALALFLVASCLELACTVTHAAADGLGGTGGASNAGGAPGTGGGAAGGDNTGGEDAGGAPSGGSWTGGNGGLGGDTATGGTDDSGGSPAAGGSAGAAYGPCDESQGTEDNPDCAPGELCVDSTCQEACPTEPDEAIAYDCPEVSTGTALSQCSFALGHCRLVCEVQGGPTYTCPDGMVCSYASCVWP